MNKHESQIKKFNKLNETAVKNGVVLFGSDFATDIPVCELKQYFDIEDDMYNRSIENLSVFDAQQLLDTCVNELCPGRLLIQLGETDLQNDYSVDEIISEYKKLIKAIKTANKQCRIIIVSVCSDHPLTHELNHRLEITAGKLKCGYADISAAAADEAPSIKAFSMLRFFIPDRISLNDIMLACI